MRNEQGYLTINLNYRLAPENPFPAGLDDCIFAAEWASANANRWGGDASRMAIGGDSAGGNLAAATTLEMAARNSPIKFKAGLLIYGLLVRESPVKIRALLRAEIQTLSGALDRLYA